MAEENLDQLNYLRPVLDEDGNPVMSSGNFAVVFKMQDRSGRFYALKCFTREQEGRAEAYKIICDELAKIASPYFVQTEYYDKELFVDSKQTDETEFPVLLMDWVEGINLTQYIENKKNSPFYFGRLCFNFNLFAEWMVGQPFAHGDLKPDNIIVRTDDSIVVVDYDGMFFPSMRGKQARELGSPDYRHPNRTAADFDEHIDDIAMASIALSLKTLSLNPSWLDEEMSADNLLLVESDNRNPSHSATLLRILELSQTNKGLAYHLGTYISALSGAFLSEHNFDWFLGLTGQSGELTKKIVRKLGLYDKDCIRLPNSITSIGECAFRDCSGLTSVTIGNSVTSIGRAAFYGCCGLTSVTIPDSVTSIGYEAFSYCRGLTSVTIGNSVTSIGNSAFSGCRGLTSVTIPDSVTKIGDRAFFGCHGLTSVTIPNSVTVIGEAAFCYCSDLMCVIIPNSVTSIGNWAFRDCHGLTRVTIGNSVTFIGDSAFQGCSGLTSVTIPTSVTFIGDSAFQGCSGLTSVTIPNSVTEIGIRAFSDCTGLTSMTIGNSVTKIGRNAFSGCSGLMSVIIPNSVTEIGIRAFNGCSGLTSVTIPNSVTEIGIRAFSDCTGLTSVHIYNLAKWCAIHFKNTTANPLYYAHHLYLNDTEITNLTIPNSVTSIGNSAFSGCSGLTSVTIPNSVTEIGNYAFYDCNSLTSVTIPNSVTEIGDYAFRGCSGLKSVTIPDSVTEIGDEAFKNCSGFTSVSIPDSVTSIGKWTFSGCSGLTTIVVENGNPNYDSRNNCNAIIETSSNALIAGCQRTVIPDSVTSIRDHAFFGCSGLTSVTIPNSATEISHGAFSDCSGLTSVTIPNSVTEIGNRAFSGCRGLTSVSIPDSIIWFGDKAFDGCSNLKRIEIPAGSMAHFQEQLPEFIHLLVEKGDNPEYWPSDDDLSSADLPF